MASSAGRSLVLTAAVVALVSVAGLIGGLGTAAAHSGSVEGDFVGSGSSVLLSPAVSSATNDTLAVRTRARPPTPGSASTHFIRVTLPASSNGSSLHALELDYGGTGAKLDGDLSLLSAMVFVEEDGNRTRIDLENASIAVADDSVTVSVPAGYPIEPGDEVSIAIEGVQNPPERGQMMIDVTVNPTQDGPTGTGTLDVRVPAPTINPQGVVGEQTRVAVHDPLGARGFIVAFDSEGEVIGTKALDPDRNLRMDIGIGSFVDDQHQRNGMTVRLAAHQDSDGDGTFEPGVDEQFQRDGEPVEATVEDAVFEDVTTTEAPTPTTAVPTTATDGVTSPTGSTTSTPGFGIVVATVGLVLGGLWYRLR